MATTLSPTSFPFGGATYFPDTSTSTTPPTTVVPTTLAPTTLAPTTVGPNTLVPTTLVPTSLTPTTFPPGWTPFPWLDRTFWPNPISIAISFEGSQFNVALAMAPIEIAISIPGAVGHPQIVLGLVIVSSAGGYVTINISPVFSYVTIEAMRANWVKWSKVGFLDFTIDQSNVAGERPVDWKGWIYSIRKLGDRIIVYGENGVTVIKPSDINMGMTTIYRIGIINPGAVSGDDGVNFFVDKESKLLKIDNKVTLLDYSEFISKLGTVILTYDKRKELLYICDGTLGFVYGARTESFGQGPPNITGVDSQSGVLYVVAPDVIVTPKFNICTDIYDFGTRKPKTIETLEVGSDLTDDLYASVDYKVSYKDSFKQIPWFLVNPGGKSYPKCYGVEFRFRLKSFIYEYFEIDYLKIKGQIHGFSPLDSTNNRSFKI
jgi:hypothetical protein